MSESQETFFSRVRVDSAGRIVIPADLRDQLGIEPGHDLILSRDGRGVPLETVQQALDGLKLTLVPFDAEHALTAANFRPPTRHLNFSFADRACLATAALARLPVLTADREWAACDLGVKLILIR